MKTNDDQGQQLFGDYCAAVPLCHSLGNMDEEYSPGDDERLGSVFKSDSSLVFQVNNCIEQMLSIIDSACKMIELTRDNWVAQGCYSSRIKKIKAQATQAIPNTQNAHATQADDCTGQLDGISDWERNMIEWRVAAAREIA